MTDLEKSQFGSITSTTTYRTQSTRVPCQESSHNGRLYRDLEWLFSVDLLYKEELVAALENELLELGSTATSHQNLRELAKKFAKSCHTGKPHPDEEVEKQLRLMSELDHRLRYYNHALIQVRGFSNPESNHRQPGRCATIDRSASQASKAYLKTSEGTIHTGPADTNTSQPSNIAKAADDPKASRNPCRIPPKLRSLVVFAVLTIVFINGAMIGLYFEREAPKRVGLVVFLVTILIIILLAVKSFPPKDIFFSAAAYAAVLVVFLSSDLAGPQQVVVVDFAGGASLVLATSTATPIQVTSISSPSEQLTSTNYLANPTTAPGVGSTLTTVVMPTIQLPATQPSTLSANPTSTVATLESPTTGFSEGSDTPTSTPEFWTSARIAGVVIGVLIGAVLIVVGSAIIDTCYCRQAINQ